MTDDDLFKDRSCAGCSRKLTASTGMGSHLNGLAGPFCRSCYRTLQKQLDDKKRP